MFELLRDQLNQSGKAIAYLRQASELEYDIKDDYDCYVKLFIHSQLEQMKKWLQFSELALKEHPSSKLISDEILCLLSNEYFEEDLPSQFKLAQLIESFQGISEESTLCKLKCSINKKDLMISHILKYFEDTIHKEQNMEEYFTQLLKFKLYIDQNNLQNLYQGVFKMSLSNPTNLNCVVLFISLITLVERKFSKNMLEEMEKVCLKNKVFENHHDQQLISFIRFFFMTYKLGYFLKWREPKETDELFVEYMQTVIKVDAASKKRFYQYPYSMCLSVNLILNEKNKLGYSSQEQDALKRFLKEFRKDGAKLHPDLAQTFNQFQ